jgi:hypothetical protein
MRFGGAAAAVAIALVGCRADGPAGPTTPINAAASGSSTRPPPAGLIAPSVGSLRLAWYWGETSDATWQAIYEVDLHDPRVTAAVENLGPGDQLDLGDIGLALYRDQLRGEGIQLTDDDLTLLSYAIQAGARQVTVRSDDSHTSGDRRVFCIYVSAPGG